MSFSAIVAKIAIFSAFLWAWDSLLPEAQQVEWERVRPQLSAVVERLDEWFPPETRPTPLEACVGALHAAVVLFIGALVVGCVLGVLGFAARCVLGVLGVLVRSVLRATDFMICCLKYLLGFLDYCVLAFFGLLRCCFSSCSSPDGVKMMKAPGGGGAWMPRQSFVDDPAGYFRGQRQKSAAASAS